MWNIINNKKWVKGLVTAAGLLLLTAILALILRRYVTASGPDWFFDFYPDAKLWLSGETLLYDSRTTGFHHPPWGIWYLSLFAVLPYSDGEALLRAVSIVMVAVTAWAFTSTYRERLWGIVLALFNLHTFDLLLRTQITALNGIGAALGWWAIQSTNPWLMGLSYLALSVSPPNTIPFAVVMLIYTWRKWDRRQFLLSLVSPLIVGILSLIMFPRWPQRWLENITLHHPNTTSGSTWNTTIWWAAHILDLPQILPILVAMLALGVTIWALFRIRQDTETPDKQRLLFVLMLMTAFIYIVTPWALSYRYVLIYAMIVPWLVSWRLEAALFLHILTFLPILRLYIGVENSWVDIIYAIAAFILTVIAVTHPQPSQKTDDHPVSVST